MATRRGEFGVRCSFSSHFISFHLFCGLVSPRGKRGIDKGTTVFWITGFFNPFKTLPFQHKQT